MEPVKINKMINTEDLEEISDKVYQKIYIHTDPENGEKVVYFRVCMDGEFDIGIQLEGPLSNKIIDGIAANIIKEDKDILNDSDDSDL